MLISADMYVSKTYRFVTWCVIVTTATLPNKLSYTHLFYIYGILRDPSRGISIVVKLIPSIKISNSFIAREYVYTPLMSCYSKIVYSNLKQTEFNSSELFY